MNIFTEVIAIVSWFSPHQQYQAVGKSVRVYNVSKNNAGERKHMEDYVVIETNNKYPEMSLFLIPAKNS